MFGSAGGRASGGRTLPSTEPWSAGTPWTLGPIPSNRRWEPTPSIRPTSPRTRCSSWLYGSWRRNGPRPGRTGGRAPVAEASAPAASGTETRLPRVAVVGRQNVGKSTLVNRLLGRKLAIAHETPGVTRDRLEIPVRWRGRSFLVVDTGGFTHRPRGIEASIARQAARAAASADLTLLVVDAQAGIQ